MISTAHPVRRSAVLSIELGNTNTVQDLIAAIDKSDPEQIKQAAYRVQRAVAYHWCRALLKFTKGVK